eukprot:TRINITY_DN5815_c0_g1_i2.p1 TRINITY_DN5815_c0_g1~~TRINITY_DN5815_c0_g1_i2.p1  ORF type:complete len:147 (+),score=25.88 TRINITY_DN5815_c0_g1_i2:200-640(+)
MNKKRFSAKQVRATRQFVLNVPVKGMEGLVCQIGKMHGGDGDEFTMLNINTCEPGWRPLRQESNDIAISDCVAHLVCSIERFDHADEGHWLIFAVIEEAYVLESYWDKNIFLPRSMNQVEKPPPYLTFLGSQQFGYVYGEDDPRIT